MTAGLLLFKAAWLAFGAWLFWDAYPESALVCAAGAGVFVLISIVTWKEN